MSWALIVMICSRLCQPQYVEVYQTREQCTQQIKQPGTFGYQTQYCVPIAKKD